MGFYDVLWGCNWHCNQLAMTLPTDGLVGWAAWLVGFAVVCPKAWCWKSRESWNPSQVENLPREMGFQWEVVLALFSSFGLELDKKLAMTQWVHQGHG